MDLNKVGGVSAAQCVSGSDIDSARRNGANVIIMGSGADTDDFAEYIAGGSKQKPIPVKQGKSAAQGAQGLPIFQRKAQQKSMKPEKVSAEQGKEEEENGKEEEEEDNDDYGGAGQVGFFSRIRRSLGIMDSDEQEDREE